MVNLNKMSWAEYGRPHQRRHGNGSSEYIMLGLLCEPVIRSCLSFVVFFSTHISAIVFWAFRRIILVRGQHQMAEPDPATIVRITTHHYVRARWDSYVVILNLIHSKRLSFSHSSILLCCAPQFFNNFVCFAFPSNQYVRSSHSMRAFVWQFVCDFEPGIFFIHLFFDNTFLNGSAREYCTHSSIGYSLSLPQHSHTTETEKQMKWIVSSNNVNSVWKSKRQQNDLDDRAEKRENKKNNFINARTYFSVRLAVGSHCTQTHTHTTRTHSICRHADGTILRTCIFRSPKIKYPKVIRTIHSKVRRRPNRNEKQRNKRQNESNALYLLAHCIRFQ